ncbi:hypothetical protein FQN49_002891, partial [Arthroderma sp. PD_2]
MVKKKGENEGSPNPPASDFITDDEEEADQQPPRYTERDTRRSEPSSRQHYRDYGTSMRSDLASPPPASVDPDSEMFGGPMPGSTRVTRRSSRRERSYGGSRYSRAPSSRASSERHGRHHQ